MYIWCYARTNIMHAPTGQKAEMIPLKRATRHRMKSFGWWGDKRTEVNGVK